MLTISISGSVGKGGRNVQTDVRAVQQRLNEHMDGSRTKLTVDGLSGPQTIGVITDFQINVVGLANADGRVDPGPGGRTLRSLNDFASKSIWQSKPKTDSGIKLSVPMVPQQRSMSCWYASTCMVIYFHVAGPRQGLPAKWNTNNGINIPDFVTLAQAEGMKTVNHAKVAFSEAQLETILRKHGPIWCAGQWDGAPHIVVLTGISDGNVYINDPNPAKLKRTETLAWFNTKLDMAVPNCMMYYA